MTMMTKKKKITIHCNDHLYDRWDMYAEEGDDYAAIIRKDVDTSYYGPNYRVEIEWEAEDEEGETVAEGTVVLEGQTPEPECPEAAEHDWASVGVWATGGTSFLDKDRCRHCGLIREHHSTGSQYNPGECDETSYYHEDD